ncbi:MAG: hypothetical protein M1827_001347 [Pycnora praestabilis]|nr:MAG: hypothetical protein M1827_001347 [Pycnora praestabilis]
MSFPPSPTLSGNLAPPRKSVEIEDPGAHDLETSENEDDHFSDASEGQLPSGKQSPIPKTRVERVDDTPSHGEVPGTPAYGMRAQDAVPDELEIVPEGSPSRRESVGGGTDRPSSPSVPIPLTVVEKVDPSEPSHGDVPGTDAYEKRKADAVPDVVVEAQENGTPDVGSSRSRSGSTPGDLPIPTTVVSKVDMEPSHGEVPGTDAYEMRKSDAEPNIVEKKGDIEGKHFPIISSTSSERLTESGSPTPAMNRSPIQNYNRRKSSITQESPAMSVSPMAIGCHVAGDLEEYNEEEDGEGEGEGDGEGDGDGGGDGADDGFGDDFDEFEEGAVDDDFGDFDDGFQQPTETAEMGGDVNPEPGDRPPVPTSSHALPLINFDDLHSIEDVLAATEPYMNELFPSHAIDAVPPPPVPSPLLQEDSLFLTERSHSLWSQLVAPPPLQPPNWVRSRIRRLFLVSLGVPVDLDEILPASKQKKLILPSTHLSSDSRSPRPSFDGRPHSSVARLKQENDSSASVNSTSSAPLGGRRRKGPPPPPDLDLVEARMLCSITDAALSNLTVEELKSHIQLLEDLKRRASEVLEYWLKRKDGAVGDKEAFEGVIENLVKHARKVRK